MLAEDHEKVDQVARCADNEQYEWYEVSSADTLTCPNTMVVVALDAYITIWTMDDFIFFRCEAILAV